MVVREKRELTTIVIAASTLVALTVNFVLDWKRSEQIHAEMEKLKQMQHLILSNSNITLDLLKQQEHVYQDAYFEAIQTAIFQYGKLETVMSFFKLDIDKMVAEFEFEKDNNNAILEKFTHNFYCGKSANTYELEVCGWTNPTRVYGDVKLVSLSEKLCLFLKFKNLDRSNWELYSQRRSVLLLRYPQINHVHEKQRCYFHRRL